MYEYTIDQHLITSPHGNLPAVSKNRMNDGCNWRNRGWSIGRYNPQTFSSTIKGYRQNARASGTFYYRIAAFSDPNETNFNRYTGERLPTLYTPERDLHLLAFQLMMNHEVMKSTSEPYYESIGIFSRLNEINRN